MPTTLISLVSTQLGFLWDPEAVELSSLDASFGVRRTDTGEVVVPAGTPLDNPQAGLWTYSFESGEGVLECCLKITPATGSSSESEDADDSPVYLTFYRYVPAAGSGGSEGDGGSESLSESDSESAFVRGISLTRSPLTRESAEGPAVGQAHDVFRVSFQASDPVLMPGDIFAYLKGPVDPRGARDPYAYFQFVATPYDSTIYPVGSPSETQSPAFYRTSSVEFLVDSSEAAQVLDQDFRAEIAALVAAYNRLDTLEPLGEVIVTGSGTVEDVPTVAAVCDGFEFADGEQLAAVVAEVAAAFD